VLEIFDSLQGEGYWTGVPMTFIRLAGCNAPDRGLGCVAWCDTPDSWDPAGGRALGTREVLKRAHLPRLCLTGGEPLLQVDALVEFLELAHIRGTRVHVETNGTVEPPNPDEGEFDWVVVSPKPPEYQVASGWIGRVDELKLVVGRDLETATVEDLAAMCSEAMVFLQPEWEVQPEESVQPGGGVRPEGGDDLTVGSSGVATSGYRESCSRAVAMVMDHPEWRLSLQAHKLLGIR
jgi:7-carboxy-7-deazaguanine synthase